MDKGDKGVMRGRLRAKRNALSKKKHLRLSEAICRHVVSDLLYGEAKSIGIFVGMGSGVNTMPIIEHALSQNKRVAIPKMHADGFEHVQIHALDDIIPGKIPSPAGDKVLKPLEVVFVPGLVFDRQGFRIGYGGGGYDRYLAGSKVPSIGLAFGFQVQEEIPVDGHDVPVDCIITEKEVINAALNRGHHRHG